MLSKLLHYIYINSQKRQLQNTDFTIISSNCIGGIIYKDLNMRFTSPTINLFFKPKDFLKFCLNLEYYLSLEIKNTYDKDKKYPVGILDDVKIYFMHYSNFTEAKECWDRRKKRVNLDNIIVIMVDRDGFTLNDLEEFKKIKYKKILLTNKKLKNDDTFRIIGFEKKEHLGNIIEFDKNNLYKRYYEQFDYISFFNK